MQRKALITGTAGFIGFHVAQRLLADGFTVTGIDAITDYYDTGLKHRRHAILCENPAFAAVHARIEEQGRLMDLMSQGFDVVVHLAAQAGVRHSIDAPRSYVEANLIGTFELLEAARAHPPAHLMIASTSSAYGANTKMPYAETDRADTPMSFYAATKKATEAMAHSYAHLYDVPTTMFRFFTVYGPWGRPDMALFKFTRAILRSESIDIYNHGDMMRDFTYVDDLVEGIRRLMDVPPAHNGVAPFRVVNIGNGAPTRLLDFVEAIEDAIGAKAERRMLPMQAGDVPATWAATELLESLVGKLPQTPLRDGVGRFVDWYRSYYN